MLTYKKLGSDADKDAVHEATKGLDKGLFPGAFCFIAPDIAGDDQYCYLKHTDGAGSKVNVAYMATREGFSNDVWKGIAHDSLVMNIDDMAAVGATESFQLTNCIDRNPLIISDEAISKIMGIALLYAVIVASAALKLFQLTASLVGVNSVHGALFDWSLILIPSLSFSIVVGIILLVILTARWEPWW